jgi:S-layer family protein
VYKLRSTFLMAGVLGVAALAGAADAQQGTLVTDPAVLASMGFSADATVYVAPGVVPGESWGTTTTSQVSHPGNDFKGRISTYAYNTDVGARDVLYTAGDTFADSSVNLASGAVWEGTRFWVNDTVASDIGLFLFQTCQPVAGPGGPTTTQVGSGTSTGTGGNQSIVVAAALPGPAPVVIDNNACFYWVRARFGGAGQILQKARSQYHLQVSAPPAVATFPVDVPTSHPFFKFIEAMAASGLTGGCGPGQFCPDTPVTRGQLSVFLASALGLHFPN